MLLEEEIKRGNLIELNKFFKICRLIFCRGFRENANICKIHEGVADKEEELHR